MPPHALARRGMRASPCVAGRRMACAHAKHWAPRNARLHPKERLRAHAARLHARTAIPMHPPAFRRTKGEPPEGARLAESRLPWGGHWATPPPPPPPPRPPAPPPTAFLLFYSQSVRPSLPSDRVAGAHGVSGRAGDPAACAKGPGPGSSGRQLGNMQLQAPDGERPANTLKSSASHCTTQQTF
jgi:hypothetical protein